MYRKTYIEINIDSLKDNVQNIIKNYPDYSYYIGVVKGNVYAHGSYTVKALIEKGINYLAVSSLEEALQIRKYDNNIPILCLEPISLYYIKKAVENNITLTVSSFIYMKELCKIGINKNVKIHLKVNTGMNRLGFKDALEVKKAYDMLEENFFVEGIYTHFITTGISDPIWDQQLETFNKITEKINLKNIPIIHMGRSLTLLNHPKIPFCNGIRLGIIMYGYNQTPKSDSSFKGKIRKLKANWRIKKYHISKTFLTSKVQLKKAFSLYTEIMEIQKINKGEHVGYGLSYTAEKDTFIAVAPIGYADGFIRKNTGRKVFIKGKIYHIVGSVNMGMIQIEVDEHVKIGDMVELIGENITPDYVAKYLGTTPYEVLCTLSDILPRVYKEKGKIIHMSEGEMQ